MTFEEILSKIEKSSSRQNRFKVDIVYPNLSEINSVERDLVTTYIQNASLPSQELSLLEVNYMGKEKYTYLFKSTDSIVLTFYDTKEQLLRESFKEWQEAIVPNSKIGVLKYFPNEYQSKMNIKIHDKTYIVEGISPQNVGDFILDYKAQDTLGTFDVTMKVKRVING